MKKPSPKVIRTFEGTAPIVKVELSNRRGEFVTVDAADYDRLIVKGHKGAWMWNLNGAKTHGYVRTKHLGNNSTVSRLILNDPSRQMITYIDGNRLNLRRRNLKLAASSRKYGRTLKAQQST